MTEFPGYLTIQQAAARLGVHRSTIYRHIERGDLSAYRSGRNASVRLVDVQELESIERVTQVKGQKRNDWSGEGWVDVMIRAGANRNSDRWVELLTDDVWPEDPVELPERIAPVPVSWDDEEDDD